MPPAVAPRRRIALVLLQIGGPDRLGAVGPFLRNFFSDPEIIRLRRLPRAVVARLIAWRRTPVATGIYRQLGGASPILGQTWAQGWAVAERLADLGEVRPFVAMRYWHPFAAETAAAVRDWRPDEIVLLPLYPQYSTTTTRSALTDWAQAAREAGLAAPTRTVDAAPADPGFVAAQADLIRRAWPRDGARLLFTAHGLPLSIVQAGDPYPGQIRASAAAVVAALGLPGLDWRIAFQSRVTPQQWLKPDTEDEVKQAGRDGVGLVLVPIAFVSEHSETLVELDIEYRAVAEAAGVPSFIRVPTVGLHPAYIAGLAVQVRHALGAGSLQAAA
ncbi:ferrochelatase [Mycobacterium sp. KBS0706]|uniref:ferrochelatase n=1 Tax=Mycobacterium sp. KBS0706 TaxID=2578109 RepID=UPI00110FCFD3|nr:ferrochelatase [Mycobacterium sp. KBS0706]TSD83852.1 ferrochelatase [Mycobacterium sp. KBS0706]